MPADGKFFTWVEFKTYLTNTQTLRSFDDDNLGEINDEAVALLFNDADQGVISHAVKGYPEEVADSVTPATAHPTLKSLALQYARAMAVDRHPGVFVTRDPESDMDRAERKLRDLAMGKTHLQGAKQSNARTETRNGVVIGGSTKRTFTSFGSY